MRFSCMCIAAVLLIPSVAAQVHPPERLSVGEAAVSRHSFRASRSGAAALIVGRVVDARGAPVSSRIDVVVACTGDMPCPDALPADARMLSAQTAADGSFRIQLPADWPASEIRVSSPGFCRVRPVDIITGDNDLDVGLLSLPAAQTLRGSVADESARPVAGARVTAIGLDGRGDLM